MSNTTTAQPMLNPTFAEWYEKFNPQVNPNNDGWGFSCGEDHAQYAVSGDDIDVVNAMFKKEPLRVWTVLDCDGNTYIVNGMAYVNRTGFIITENSALPDTDYEVLEYEDDANMYSRLLDEGNLKTIYQVKPEFRTEDMDDNDVFGNLEDASLYYSDVPENGWNTIDCSDGCPIENPCFIA
jgi:hypothetical protein